MISETLAEERIMIADAQRGDRAAFGWLVRNYQRRAYAAAYTFVGNREDALEMAQDSFVKAYRAMGRFDTSMPFYPWLYRIVKNTCLNHIKKRNRRGEVSLEGMRESGQQFVLAANGPDHSVEMGELRGDLVTALEMLSEDHREIITLRHIHEESYKDIAECLGIPQGTVMSRLHAARKKLREALNETNTMTAGTNA